MTEDNNKKRVTREDLVHPKFVTRWAMRYLEISATKGRAFARGWANRFLNPADGDRVADEVRRIKSGLPPPA